MVRQQIGFTTEKGYHESDGTALALTKVEDGTLKDGDSEITVDNAKKIRNIDFAASTVTQVGNNIFSKKVLIYNAKDSNTTNGMATEFEVSLSKTLDLQPFYKYQIEFDIEHGDTTLYFQTPVCFYNGNDTNYLCSIFVPTILTADSGATTECQVADQRIYLTPTMVKVELRNYISSNNPVYRYMHPTKLTVRKIYRIIE